MKHTPLTERVGRSVNRSKAREYALVALASGLLKTFIRLRSGPEPTPPKGGGWRLLNPKPNYPRSLELRASQTFKDYVHTTRPSQIIELRFDGAERGRLFISNNSDRVLTERHLGSLAANAGLALMNSYGSRLGVAAVCIGDTTPKSHGLNRALGLSGELLMPEAAADFEAALKAGLAPEIPVTTHDHSDHVDVQVVHHL